MTRHSFRATFTTRLYSAGYEGPTIFKRTRHKNEDSSRPYQNLKGSLGKQQQDILLSFDKNLDGNKNDTVDDGIAPSAKLVKFYPTAHHVQDAVHRSIILEHVYSHEDRINGTDVISAIRMINNSNGGILPVDIHQLARQ